ncbi:MAG: DNA primase DnaG [Candidatus Marsarchaeota archaeon]|jgi:DNA primase|nr:DNA primase DnaG [Candidatus Marsarchaeota archaeon]
MAKTYIDILKYLVEANFEIGGLVEKPDIIGAVFGQTEGLLGGDLDLRELQKNGKIGRIEIDTTQTNNRTAGKLFLPSSLNRVETCILAASIESVDRVGPFETSFKIMKIEDTRNEKRKRIINRAKELIKQLLTTELPDSRELSDLVESDVKASVITTYGSENLPAGPDIAVSDDIILVEGRADVVNLLKNDLTNCIAIGGATGIIPKTIIDLIRTKETTLFLDGDRGGDIILKGIINIGEVDFVARAPDGKEVEELTRKEIIKSLRSRIPLEQITHSIKKERPEFTYQQAQQNQNQSNIQKNKHQFVKQPQQENVPISPTTISTNLLNQQPQQKVQQKSNIFNIKNIDEEDESEKSSIDNIPSIIQEVQAVTSESNILKLDKAPFINALNELHNTLRGRIYNSAGHFITEIPISELIPKITDIKDAKIIVFNGIITQRLVDAAHKIGISAIYGIRTSQISRPYDDIFIYTKE